MKYTHRYIARIILEAKTALFVGSGETSFIKDALIQKDHYGFPMIQGTSLMGVLRHALEDGKTEAEKMKLERFFGCQLSPQEIKKRETENQAKPKEEQVDKIESGFGSKIKISSAYLLFPDGKIADGLMADGTIPYQQYLSQFDNLPSRQHVRITHKGVADTEDGGLFENEVVYNGCRFIFEMEVKGNDSETDQWYSVLNQLKNPLFRLGQGTRNGYGKLKVESCKQKIFNLNDSLDYEAYLNFNPSFNSKNDCLESIEDKLIYQGNALIHYKLELTPDSFFIFGSGYGDEQVDNKPIEEEVLIYNKTDQAFHFISHTLIPASSIKGAISHRTCFHYNKLEKIYADKIDSLLHKKHIGINNEAVANLFGVKAGEEEATPSRGRVIIDDLYISDIDNDTIINHVAIDRFTGGAINGALFSEKVSQRGGAIEVDIYLEKKESKNENIELAFENTLKDICKGLLPLGGMTTKGHGIFTGTLSKNETKIYTYGNEI